MIQRTWWPRLNRSAQLAKGLVFAGLGGGASTLQYADASGYGRHGLLTNMDGSNWVFDPAIGRWTLDFNATSDYVDLGVPSKRLFYAVPSITFSCWVKTTQTDRASLMGMYNGSAPFYEFDVNRGSAIPDSGKLWCGARKTTTGQDLFGYTTDDTVANDGNWHHVAFVMRLVANQIAFYVDGVPQATTVSVASYGVVAQEVAYAQAIGAQNNAGTPGTWYGGSLADVIGYGRVLSPAEIQQLADPSNTLLSGLILPPRRMVFPAAVAGGIPEGYANLSAIADLAATGYTEHIGSATLAAQADIAAVGYHESAGTATLSAVAGMEAVGYIEHCGTATLVAAAGIEAVGHATHYGDATLSAIADLTAIGYVTHAGHSVLSAIADITATGEAPTLVPEGSAVLSAVASIDAVGYAAARGEATLQAVASIAATGYAEANGHAVLSAIADMAAVGEAPVVDVPQGYAVLDAVADMAAEGYAEHAGYAVLSAVAGITAVGEAKGGEVPSTGGKTADGLTWPDVDGLEWAEVDGLEWTHPTRLETEAAAVCVMDSEASATVGLLTDASSVGLLTTEASSTR